MLCQCVSAPSGGPRNLTKFYRVIIAPEYKSTKITRADPLDHGDEGILQDFGVDETTVVATQNNNTVIASSGLICARGQGPFNNPGRVI